MDPQLETRSLKFLSDEVTNEMGAPTTNGQKMSEETALAVLNNEVLHIKEIVERIDRNAAANVTRTAWEQRNQYVDDKFIAVNREVNRVEADNAKDINALWTEIKSKRVPWTSVGAFVIAGITLLTLFIERFTI